MDVIPPSLRPRLEQQAAAESAGFCRGRSRSMLRGSVDHKVVGLNTEQMKAAGRMSCGQTVFFYRAGGERVKPEVYLVFLEAPAGSEC